MCSDYYNLHLLHFMCEIAELELCMALMPRWVGYHHVLAKKKLSINQYNESLLPRLLQTRLYCIHIDCAHNIM